MGATVSYLLMLQKLYQFRAKDSGIKKITFTFRKYFTANNKKKKTIKWICLQVFLVIIILLILVILSISINI